MLIDRQGRCVPSTAVSHLLVWPLSANKHTHSWPHHRQTDTRIRTLTSTPDYPRIHRLPTPDTVPMGMVMDFSLLPLASVTQAETIPALLWPTTDLYSFSVPCELWPLHAPNPVCTTAQNCWCLTDRLSVIRLLQLYSAELCSYVICYSLDCLQTPTLTPDP